MKHNHLPLQTSRLLLIAALLALSATAPGWAATIVSTFSTGNTFNDGTGTRLDYPGPAACAYTFTTPAGSDYDLNEIDIALTRVASGSTVSVQLRSDQSASPGAVLKTWSLTGLPIFGNTHTLDASQQITGISGVTLSSGTSYWIAAVPAAPGSDVVWNYNNYPTSSTGVSAIGALSSSGGVSWFPSGSTTTPGGFAVYANPIPEPSAVSLMLAGIVALWQLRSKRKL